MDIDSLVDMIIKMTLFESLFCMIGSYMDHCAVVITECIVLRIEVQ